MSPATFSLPVRNAICPFSFPVTMSRKSFSATVSVQFGAAASPSATAALPSFSVTLYEQSPTLNW